MSDILTGVGTADNSTVVDKSSLLNPTSTQQAQPEDPYIMDTYWDDLRLWNDTKIWTDT